MQKIALVVLLIAGLLLAACGAKETPPPAPPTPPPAVDAARLYAATCAGCHGQNREGVTGVAPPLTAQALAARSEAQVRDIIAKGMPGTAMPAFSTLTPAELDALAQFLKR